MKKINKYIAPCPLCSEQVNTQNRQRPTQGHIYCFYIQCTCGLKLTKYCNSFDLEETTLNNLINLWNTRIGDKMRIFNWEIRRIKSYEVWLEGFHATGESGTARYLGTHEAGSFKDAVIRALKHKKFDMAYFNEEKLTYWGCNFQKTEKAARKYYG